MFYYSTPLWLTNTYTLRSHTTETESRLFSPGDLVLYAKLTKQRTPRQPNNVWGRAQPRTLPRSSNRPPPLLYFIIAAARAGVTCHAPLVSPLRQSPPLDRDQYTPLPHSMDALMLAEFEYTYGSSFQGEDKVRLAVRSGTYLSAALPTKGKGGSIGCTDIEREADLHELHVTAKGDACLDVEDFCVHGASSHAHAADGRKNVVAVDSAGTALCC